MDKHLQYAGMPLDRCDALRRDDGAIEQLWQSEQTVIIPMCQGKNLFVIDDCSNSASPEGVAGLPSYIAPQPVLLRRAFADSAALAVITRANDPVFLGQQAADSYFAIEIDEFDKETLCDSQQAKFIDLRSVGAVLAGDMAALLAYARGILFWRQQHRFCSRCGYRVTASHGGHVLACNNGECGRETYPRTDPAVIMLVERAGPDGVQQCLLGRHPNWPPGSLSTLAGFVEPGESLEEAVRREVAEESGVVVGDVHYLASQPWPFPASIMLGFIAEARETTINIDPHELEEAAWYSRAELSGFGVWGDESSSHNLPRKDSIARFLIDHWLARGD